MAQISVKSKVVFFLLITLLVIMLGVILDKTGLLSPLKDVTLKITSPFQIAFSRAGHGVSNFFGLLGSIKNLSRENQELKNRNAQLVSENTKLKEVKKENSLLRRQLGFQKENNFHLLKAEVINRNPQSAFQFITLDQGEKAGIKEGQAVTFNGALIGIVKETDYYTAKVLLITDQTSIVNAYIQESRASGIVKGQLGYSLKMELIPQNVVVKEGDTIITSGLGGLLPKGLTIGTIDSVDKANNEIFQTALIKPTVSFKDLETVFVILGH